MNQVQYCQSYKYSLEVVTNYHFKYESNTKSQMNDANTNDMLHQVSHSIPIGGSYQVHSIKMCSSSFKGQEKIGLTNLQPFDF